MSSVLVVEMLSSPPVYVARLLALTSQGIAL